MLDAMREVGRKSRTHGMTGTPTYRVWQGLINRCTNTKDKSYPHYGGRGIQVVERWHSFENFLADMGFKPEGKSIDRIDNDGPYSPENCRWASPLEQTRNRRNAVNVTLDGVTKPLAVWCELRGVNYATAIGRLKRYGWSVERVFAEPRPDRIKEEDVQTIRELLFAGYRQKEIAERFGISQAAVSKIKLRPIRPDADPVEAETETEREVTA